MIIITVEFVVNVETEWLKTFLHLNNALVIIYLSAIKVSFFSTFE